MQSQAPRVATLALVIAGEQGVSTAPPTPLFTSRW